MDPRLTPKTASLLYAIVLLEERSPACAARLVHLWVLLDALLELALRVLEQRIEDLHACRDDASSLRQMHLMPCA